ncbi:unnamed protein product [Nezara viridula]|uniref:Uncharacterized protein n=1 Tax=Nezara viridula TaxID=85310 RepID=A0A9P0E7U9_NEZVI|nr:unnamed protein product [Nezara viridula]
MFNKREHTPKCAASICAPELHRVQYGGVVLFLVYAGAS